MSAKQLGYGEPPRPTMFMGVEKLAKDVKVTFRAIRLPDSERRE
jgi:hypothetical protein